MQAGTRYKKLLFCRRVRVRRNAQTKTALSWFAMFSKPCTLGWALAMFVWTAQILTPTSKSWWGTGSYTAAPFNTASRINKAFEISQKRLWAGGRQKKNSQHNYKSKDHRFPQAFGHDGLMMPCLDHGICASASSKHMTWKWAYACQSVKA